eukprot:Blabericola_migrator_1__1852@NODE_1502_length_4400_cov_10_457881_g985_i0_p2_GENE_NODE_1502_length_4400_cov_10_457881_g985_i0NODE_1502_length_4400_cov_10_457881_g985_i0_p2_ORF_typecomplete_len109_score10_27_NODE_1502_length_4400_cov_10_457881_g985_i023872713
MTEGPSHFVLRLIGRGLGDQSQAGKPFVLLASFTHRHSFKQRHYTTILPNTPYQSLNAFLSNLCPSLKILGRFKKGIVDFTHLASIRRVGDAITIVPVCRGKLYPRSN